MTEELHAAVVATVLVDDGQGVTIAVTKRVETAVPSKPRPADACEVRAYPEDAPEIAGYGPWDTSIHTEEWQGVGSVYLVDSCGNVLHGLGKNDSPDHDQPGDAFRVTGVTPGQGGEVWATAALGTYQWLYGLTLYGTHDFGNNKVGIPEGTYQINLEIASTADCGDGAHIIDGYTADFANGRLGMNLWWDWGRGAEPTGLTASPEGALRDPATGAVAAWRVLPIDSGKHAQENTGNTYTDIPVKLYVADAIVYLDPDGNVVEDYREVPGVELCTGEVHQLIDADHPWPGQVTATCDQIHAGEVTLSVSSDPPGAWNTAGYDGPLGISVGITKAPSEPGDYYLVAEPLDEAFRRGQSWKIDHGLGWPRPVVGFTVMGGVFLDEDYMPVADPGYFLGPRRLYLRAQLPATDDTVQVTYQIEAEGGALATVEGTLARLTSAASGLNTYLGAVDLTRDPGQGNTAGQQAHSSQALGNANLVVPDGFLAFLKGVWHWVGGSLGIASVRLEGLTVEITKVKGLYTANDTYQDGYKSLDNEGRVFNNWVYDHDDPSSGTFEGSERFVDVTAQVGPEGAHLPGGLRVRWNMVDPDDPSNGDPGDGGNPWPVVTRRAGCEIDKNDYLVDDQTGQCLSRLAESPGYDNCYAGWSLWWDVIPDPDYTYQLSRYTVDPPVPGLNPFERALTSVDDNGLTRVRFNTGPCSGDNYRVVASLVMDYKPEPEQDDPDYQPASDTTGVFTLWKRMFLEERWMEASFSLPPVASINDAFKPAFVEFITPNQDADDHGPATDWLHLEPLNWMDDGYPASPGESAFVGKVGVGDGQFHHRGDGLWVLLAACRSRSWGDDYDPPAPYVTGSGGVVVDATTFEDPNASFTDQFSQLVLKLQTSDGYWLPFEIILNTSTQFVVKKIVYFDPSGGTIVRLDLASSHLTFSGEYRVEEPKVTGATPGPQSNSILYYATMQNAGLAGDAALETAIHELVHSFGLDHNCGETDTSGSFSSVMNWAVLPVLVRDQSGTIVGLEWKPAGNALCADHIKAIRVFPLVL